MSTANSNNCHVSTTTSKWEDTGGNHPKPSDCDGAILLNAVDCTNDISLQELIENELALRSSTTSANTVVAASNGDCKINGKLLDDDDEDVDEDDATTASEDLICDTEHDDFVAKENRKNLSRNRLNSLSPVEASNRCRTVDEVDDFEMLYKEVSSGEGIANGHSILVDPFESVSEATTLSESSVKNGCQREDDDDDSYAADLPREAINTAVLDSLETDTSSRSIEENLIDVSDTDFVPVSVIRVVDGSQTENVINEPKMGDDGAISNSFVDEDNEWVRVADVVNGEEGVKCAESEEISSVEEKVGAIAEKERTKVVEKVADEVVIERVASADLYNGWSAPRAHEPEVVVLCDEDVDDYLSYGDAERAVNGGGVVEERNQQVSQMRESKCGGEDTTTTLIESIKKSGAKLIEECSFSVTRDSLTNEVVLESNSSAEKKTVKKKKTASEESVTTTKTKKTKKTKKYDEKENISVSILSPTQNGIEDPNFHQIVDDGDELSNVCVRELKIQYCNEASKMNETKLAQYEEPVPASIPIKELTRSFGDLRTVTHSDDSSPQINSSTKSVSMSDLSFTGGVRSLREKKTVRDLKRLADGKMFRDRTLVKSLTIKYEALNNERAALKSKLRLSDDLQRSGFGKFDQLTKKSVMQVRSSDPAKAQQPNSQSDGVQDSGSICKACNKNVFAMEQIKAERHVWHKNCFRCKTCNKQLTVDVYSSHEGELYCKPHFRDLFKPKVVVEEEKPVKFRKPELIIRENQPLELPPDVVRASDKPDLGLEELGSLNVKSRFQVFEKQQIEEQTDKSPICVKRSPSILSKLAKFQAKGMNVGVSSDEFNGIEYEESSSSEEEPAQNDNVTKSSVTKEKPIAFNKMNDVKKNWENGQASRREERLEERRQEKQNIRSRLFMGKQNKMREAYENAVAESERNNVRKDVEVKCEKARSIKEKFEKGESLQNDDSDEDADKKTNAKNDDMDVFEAGISKKSRSIFQQMDAAIKTQTNHNNFSPSPQPMQNGHARPRKEMITRQVSEDVVRASDPVEEVTVKTADVSSKFKFFETYKAPEVKRKTFRITPPREGQLLKSESPERDTNKYTDVVRCEDQLENENEVLKKSNTTAKMLSLFRQLEEAQETVPDGPKPMKKFTPPPMSNSSSDNESDDESEEASEASVIHDDVIRASDKTEDEYLKMAQQAARAKSLREKFEKWEPEKQSNNNAINMIDSEQASLDTTKSLRARFESMKAAEQQVDKPRPKVHRFVDKSLPGYCDTCMKKVYPLEKVEAGDKVFHRSCFKCTRCNGILRMETFTMNNGHLYCVPHFKQLFITKGNYDEGFGNNQHKSKWPVHTGVTVTNGVH